MPAQRLKSAFETLGVVQQDDAAKIRRAWLKLVRAYHPDMYRGDKAAANEKLAEINAAFDLVETYFADPKTPQTRADAAHKAEAARRAEAVRRARAEAAAKSRADKAEADARAFEAEMEALLAKRAADARRAEAALKARTARRASPGSSWSQAERIAARAAQMAFEAARRSLEADYVAQTNRYA